MQFVVYLAGLAATVFTMSSIGTVLAIILGVLVSVIGSLILNGIKVREIKDEVDRQRQNPATNATPLSESATDEKLSLSKLEQLAESGDACAQVRLGEMYTLGREIPTDHHKASLLFLKAAEKGNPDAQFYVGGMYEQGKVVPKDSLMAMQWYVKAAEGGNEAAQTILASRLEN